MTQREEGRRCASEQPTPRLREPPTHPSPPESRGCRFVSKNAPQNMALEFPLKHGHFLQAGPTGEIRESGAKGLGNQGRPKRPSPRAKQTLESPLPADRVRVRSLHESRLAPPPPILFLGAFPATRWLPSSYLQVPKATRC